MIVARPAFLEDKEQKKVISRRHQVWIIFILSNEQYYTLNTVVGNELLTVPSLLGNDFI